MRSPARARPLSRLRCAYGLLAAGTSRTSRDPLLSAAPLAPARLQVVAATTAHTRANLRRFIAVLPSSKLTPSPALRERARPSGLQRTPEPASESAVHSRSDPAFV